MAAIVAAIISCLGAARQCAITARRPGSVDAVVALDDGTALVRWRGLAPADDRWLLRVDARGHTRWRQALPPAADRDERPGALIVHAGVVALRYGRSGRLGIEDAAIAFDLATGVRLWDVALTEPGARPAVPARMASGPSAVALPVGADRLAFWTGDGDRSVVHVLHARTGIQLEAVATPGLAGPPLALGERVIVRAGAGAALIDLGAGTAPQTITTRHQGCRVGDEYVMPVEVGNGSEAVVAYAAAGPSRDRIVALPWRAPGGDDGRVVGCGRHRDEWVLTIDRGDGGPALIAITDRNAVVRRTFTIERPVARAAGPAADEIDAGAPFDGELTGYVPYLAAATAGGAPAARLVVYDLKRGAEAWSGPPDPALRFARLLRAGSTWYLATATTLATFDGRSGELIAAIRDPDRRPSSVGPAQIAAGVVWLASATVTAGPSPLRIVALAGPALRDRGGGDRVRDVTAELRARLAPTLTSAGTSSY